ncbi:hypothetical protein CEUSTIGMA_g4733.t1 [Chlamydomonas eustigma]|uniref:Uncharacterized protein n=1 Tax=Chlamydomonas eustigma TaxID=1157962 RepID=A0A250X2I2_9CHLO|nr:hypothetical protein CEUSTIGMA_g4733.t1 [Chlamydomonas eustigma]|eukprot:GAX77287.1 hypothetical protein CEUSTIGMA_g4733.t1 [Chlamydomonas eustigma]
MRTQPYSRTLVLVLGLFLHCAKSSRDIFQNPSQFVSLGNNPEADVPQAAGIQFVARQAMFDYASVQGLLILKDRLKALVIPDVERAYHVPVLGDFNVKISNIKVDSFNVSEDEAKVVILDRYFNMFVGGVTCHLTFNWHWDKLGIEGSGDGELMLTNGNINYVFQILKNPATTRPEVSVQLSENSFEAVDLKIHSNSADWLYQAAMSLFNDRISSAVHRGIDGALSGDVPNAINNILASLPTHVQVQGLPFNVSFDYSFYTLSYVLLKGYGMVGSSSPPHAQSTSVDGSSSTAASAEVQKEQVISAPLSAESLHEESGQGVLRKIVRQLQSIYLQKAGIGDSLDGQCPYQAVDLPLGADVIALEPHMVTFYLHESILNCLLWGLYGSGGLKTSANVAGDLLATLLPAVPKTYPHQELRIDIQALAAPKVTFQEGVGISLTASYRTTIYVNNQTLGTPLIAQLDAEVSAVGQLNWDSTTITSAVAKHTLVQATIPVSTAQWDGTVAWFIQNYAGLYPLNQIVKKFVNTPVVSLVSLVRATGVTLEGWFGLSGDIMVLKP